MSRRATGVDQSDPVQSRVLRWLLVVDVTAVLVGIGLASVFRSVLEGAEIAAELEVSRHLIASAAVGAIVMLCFWAQSLYALPRQFAGTKEYSQIAHAVTYAVVVALSVSYFAGTGPLVSRSWLVLVWICVLATAVLGRFALRRLVRALRRRGGLVRRLVIVGASAAAVAIARQFVSARQEGVKVVGFLDEYLPLGEPVLEDISVIGRPRDLARGMVLPGVDEYVLVPQALPHERLDQITALMASRDRPIFRVVVTPTALLTHAVRVSEIGQVPVLTLQRARITGLDALVKRVVDIAVASTGLMVLGVPALVTLAGSWLRGRGPLTELRYISGPNGRSRELRLLARHVNRRLLLRGVPALFAVIRGDLSLVGPRPVTVGTAEHAYPALTAVRPGLTGAWRLGGSFETMDEQRTRDLAYVQGYTIWEDFRIVFESLRRLVGRPSSELGRWERRVAERAEGEPAWLAREHAASA